MKGTPSRDDNLDVIALAMFDDTVQLSETQSRMLAVVRDTYTYWLANPIYTDKQIRDYMRTEHHLDDMQSMRYLYAVKVVLGHVPHAAKEWFRYKANYVLDLALEAVAGGDNNKAKSYYKIADSISKVNNLDRDEGEDIDYSKIVPQDLSLTVDPTVLGIKPIPDLDKKVRMLRKKYGDEMEEFNGTYIRKNDGSDESTEEVLPQ